MLRIALVAFALAALTLAACGGGDDEESGGDANRFEEAGFAISFEYPDGFEVSDDVTLTEQEGSQAQETKAVGLDSENGIIVQRYGLKTAIDAEKLDLAKEEFDRLVATLAPEAAEGKKTEVGGFPALSYPSVPVTEPANAESRLYVLFDGRTEYLINCQSTPNKRSEVEEACDLAVETLEAKK